MNTMSYRGYTARVEFDDRDNVFIGRILGIHNMISFHGTTVVELRREFESAVNDYLTDCEAQGDRGLETSLASQQLSSVLTHQRI